MSQEILAITIVSIAVILFITEKIPLAMTASLAAIAMGVFGIIEIKDVYKGFSSTASIMAVSMMIIGDAAFENGLAQAMGSKLMGMGLGKNQRVLLVVLTTFSIILSAFFSNSAVVAMMIPLLASIVVKSNGVVKNKYVLIAVGMGASAGGFCTLSGSTPQLAAQDFLMSTEGLQPMSYFELAKVGLPLCLIMIAYFATVGYTLEKKVLKFDDVIPGLMESKTETAPQISTKKLVITGLVLIYCVAGFVTGIWDIAVVALVGVCILTLTKCINLKKSLSRVDWNTIVILSMAQGFAKGMDESGAGALIANGMLNLFGGENASIYAVMAALMIVIVILTNFMSNLAVITMFLPIGYNLALSLGIRPETVIIGMTLACQLATMTPIGSPCVTQTLVGGYRYMDYVKIGVPVTVLQAAACIALVPIVYGL